MRSLATFFKYRITHQILAFIAINPYLKGFLQGTIYQGKTKQFCVPVLNCYSCPGAIFSCPIGTLQHMIVYFKYHFSLIVIGTLMLTGGLAGRWVCGHICPFGLVQDVVARITKKKFNPPQFLRIFPWVFLVGFTIVLPLLLRDPTFCKYICPQGTLQGGLWLPFFNSYSLGILYVSKITLLIAIVVASIYIVRPFCRYICPLGLLLGFFNKISLFQMRVGNACISCNACQKACPMDIAIYKSPDSISCIRCNECIPACPVSCITFSAKVKEATNEKNTL